MSHVFSHVQSHVSKHATPHDGPNTAIYFGSFDGVDDYVDLPFLFDPSTSYEIRFTFRYPSMTGTDIVFDARDANDDGLQVAMVNGAIRARHNATNATSSSAVLDDDEWHDVVITWDGANIDVEVDEVSSVTVATGAIAVTTNPKIGRRSFSSTLNQWIGDLKDVTIIDDGATEAIYTFNQSSGTEVTDSSGNANHGTLQGDTGANFWQTE